MLCLILIVGDVLIMMGQHDRLEGLFNHFRLDDQIPETHRLRLIEKHISFAFARPYISARVRQSRSARSESVLTPPPSERGAHEKDIQQYRNQRCGNHSAENVLGYQA
jgi:hypothetical protein